MKLVRFTIISIIICMIISGTILAQGFVVYKVERGDTLTKIASYFNVALDKIFKINNITNPNLIKVGQRLKIPAENKTYKIKEGDTLLGIANKYNVNLKQLIKFNKISNPNKIFPGQKLIIPSQTSSRKKRTRKLLSRNYQLHFIWPVQGKVSSPFGWRIHPITGKRDFHSGVDLAVPIGTPVYAAEDGFVVRSGKAGGYGNLVVIRHRNNRKTYYGHNIKLLVKVGQRVKKGKVIALSGSSGRSTGPHLHFEIRIDNRVVNPMRYLNQKYLDRGFHI